jgi:DNA-binding CsgD family transcriptional regulator
VWNNPVRDLTQGQQEAVDALAEHGSQQKAAEALGISRSTIRSRLKWAARKGYAPGHFENGTAPGYLMGKVTVQRGPMGNVERVWERQSPEAGAALEAIKQAIQAFADELQPIEPVAPPTETLEELCNLYTFTDYHLGMLAWHKEGGEDWDLAIAERTLARALTAMIKQSPKAHTAIINVQGDFLHTDGKLPLTPASKHALDADTRFPKLRQAAIRLIRDMVRKCLESHAQVHLIIAEGNHDEESAGWLADLFGVFYEAEPRLSVNDSQLPFYCFEWGDCMIGVHHGHKVKNEALPLLFAAQFPEAWGRTKRREIHCGHRHHRDEKEYNGVTIIQHPTLAARDAYAARGGWIADRASWAITYHKRFGAVGRVCITPEMLG